VSEQFPIPVQMNLRGLLVPRVPEELARHQVFAPRDASFSFDDYLYHYTKAETLQKIAANRQFKMRRFATMNDPRESKAWTVVTFDIGFGEPPPDDPIDQGAVDAEVARFKDNVKVAAFTRDVSHATETEENRTQYLGAGFAHPAMWAHYADTHRGVCIVFDKRTLVRRFMEQSPDSFGDPSQVRHGEVTYTAHEPRGDESFLAMPAADVRVHGFEEAVHRHFAGLQVWFQKHLDWSSEAEYRFVYPDRTDRNAVFVDISNCVVALVLGVDFSESDLDVAQGFAQAFGIGGRVGRSVWTGPCWGIQAMRRDPTGWRFEEPVRIEVASIGIQTPPVITKSPETSSE
jgi:hypothetical protein